MLVDDGDDATVALLSRLACGVHMCKAQLVELVGIEEHVWPEVRSYGGITRPAQPSGIYLVDVRCERGHDCRREWDPRKDRS